MRNKRNLRNLAILVALVAVTLGIGFYGSMNKSRTGSGNAAISLEAPSFISVAEAASTGVAAFPADKAGMSAYVKLTTPIDIDKVRPIFSKVEDVGDNYIAGIVPIPNASWEASAHLYADADGWLVAYLTRDEPASKIFKNPSPSSLKSTTLPEAISNGAAAAGVAALPEIKFYDFRFPGAEVITVFTIVAKNPPKITQVKIPADWTLYEASYYTSGDVYVDEKRFYQFGSYQGAITTGTLHTIKTGSSVATMLIYTTK